MVSALNDTFVGQKAPVFSLLGTGGHLYSLSTVTHFPLVLYFYPKDHTSGCTQQACEAQALIPTFKELGITLWGISKDAVKSHEKFAHNHTLSFPLLSDPDGSVCQHYDVWKEKSLYGRKYFGIERSTFVIDAQHSVQAVWRKVKVTGHWEQVLEVVTGLL